jgi:membrane protease YdiL (CAAX protease family)
LAARPSFDWKERGGFSVAFARLRFVVFIIIVLGLPAGLMAATDPQLVDLGKLAMILSPAVAGLALSTKRWSRGSATSWGWISGAAAITLLVTLGALSVAIAVGAASFRLEDTPLDAVMRSPGGSALTSVLEELGWAGGGLTLAIAAFGRRWGVLVLGLVWAAWHLVPVVLKVGLFPYLETAPPLMIPAFIASCLIYRELLTVLRERSGSWLGAAAGHAAPNILLAGLLAAGVELSDRTEDWPFFPAPGGLVFPLLALVALKALRRGKLRLV